MQFAQIQVHLLPAYLTMGKSGDAEGVEKKPPCSDEMLYVSAVFIVNSMMPIFTLLFLFIRSFTELPVW